MTQLTYFYDMIPIQYEVSDELAAHITSTFSLPPLPEETASFDLNQSKKGTTITTRVLLNEFEIRQTKTKKSFLKITFSNQAGNIPAKMWDNNGAVLNTIPLLEKEAIFDIHAQVDEFNGYKSLTINSLAPCQDQIDPFQLLAYTKQDLSQLRLELFAYLYELKEPFQQISIQAMEQLWDAFRLSPAAKGHHHNYLGGLLKHTVGLMRFCRYIVLQEENPFKAVMKLINKIETQYKLEIWDSLKSDDQVSSFVWKDTIDHLYHMLQGMTAHKFDDVHYDALITSILFHDIGKLMEYDYAGKSLDIFRYLYPTAHFAENDTRKQAGITMDPLGVLIGHIPYGVLLLTKIIEEKKISISMEEIHLMSHCILCHHGLPEWGSAVRKPLNLEGYIIHIVDYLDSRYENTETFDQK